jgi:hypothetical protein
MCAHLAEGRNEQPRRVVEEGGEEGGAHGPGVAASPVAQLRRAHALPGRF